MSRKGFGSTEDRRRLEGPRSATMRALKSAKSAVSKAKKGKGKGVVCRRALGAIVTAAMEAGIYSERRYTMSKTNVSWRYPKSSEAARVHGPIAGAIRDLSRKYAHACIVGKKPTFYVG